MNCPLCQHLYKSVAFPSLNLTCYGCPNADCSKSVYVTRDQFVLEKEASEAELVRRVEMSHILSKPRPEPYPDPVGAELRELCNLPQI